MCPRLSLQNITGIRALAGRRRLFFFPPKPFFFVFQKHSPLLSRRAGAKNVSALLAINETGPKKNPTAPFSPKNLFSVMMSLGSP